MINHKGVPRRTTAYHTFFTGRGHPVMPPMARLRLCQDQENDIYGVPKLQQMQKPKPCWRWGGLALSACSRTENPQGIHVESSKPLPLPTFPNLVQYQKNVGSSNCQTWVLPCPQKTLVSNYHFPHSCMARNWVIHHFWTQSYHIVDHIPFRHHHI